MRKEIKKGDFYSDIKAILSNARNKAFKAVNSVMVDAYWNVGRRIVEEEQKGRKRRATARNCWRIFLKS